MSVRFWEPLDSLAHRRKWLFPRVLRAWICDRLDLAYGCTRAELRATGPAEDEERAALIALQFETSAWQED